MGVIITAIIIYNLFLKDNPERFWNFEKNIGKIIGILILASVVSSLIPTLLAASFGLIPLIIFIKILSGIFGTDSNKKNEKYREEYREYSGQTANKSDKKRGNRSEGKTGLTRSVPKRRKIVEKFNKKYGLNLTETEIERIVDASYTSYNWEKEIYDMQEEYYSQYEWFNSDTNWLRAYLKVFPIQSVSSDFARQRYICLDVFEQIFTEVGIEQYSNVDECIDAINNKYMTFFDENTFMIAYRFLEANGRSFKLPGMDVIRNESDLDRLMNKYDAENERYESRRRVRV